MATGTARKRRAVPIETTGQQQVGDITIETAGRMFAVFTNRHTFQTDITTAGIAAAIAAWFGYARLDSDARGGARRRIGAKYIDHHFLIGWRGGIAGRDHAPQPHAQSGQCLGRTGRTTGTFFIGETHRSHVFAVVANRTTAIAVDDQRTSRAVQGNRLGVNFFTPAGGGGVDNHLVHKLLDGHLQHVVLFKILQAAR